MFLTLKGFYASIPQFVSTSVCVCKRIRNSQTNERVDSSHVHSRQLIVCICTSVCMSVCARERKSGVCGELTRYLLFSPLSVCVCVCVLWCDVMWCVQMLVHEPLELSTDNGSDSVRGWLLYHCINPLPSLLLSLSIHLSPFPSPSLLHFLSLSHLSLFLSPPPPPPPSPLHLPSLSPYVNVYVIVLYMCSLSICVSPVHCTVLYCTVLYCAVLYCLYNVWCIL